MTFFCLDSGGGREELCILLIMLNFTPSTRNSWLREDSGHGSSALQLTNGLCVSRAQGRTRPVSALPGNTLRGLTLVFVTLVLHILCRIWYASYG